MCESRFITIEKIEGRSQPICLSLSGVRGELIVYASTTHKNQVSSLSKQLTMEQLRFHLLRALADLRPQICTLL